MKKIHALILIAFTSLLSTPLLADLGRTLGRAGFVAEGAERNRIRAQEMAIRRLDMRNRQLENERLQLENEYQRSLNALRLENERLRLGSQQRYQT